MARRTLRDRLAATETEIDYEQRWLGVLFALRMALVKKRQQVRADLRARREFAR